MSSVRAQTRPYHKGPDVRAFLAKDQLVVSSDQLPPLFAHLNPIERLWAVLHQYVTHNRLTTQVRSSFADAILGRSMRENHPAGMDEKFPRTRWSDNFRRQ